tara:strand:- start:1020 stop:1742 length:723 start_codon:yes stop_codon:yes gene_type:complete
MNAGFWQPAGVIERFQQSAFDRWWSMPGEWVEERNQRRGGESGVKLLPPLKGGQPPLYSKRQVGHVFRSLRHPLGLPTVLREQHALMACEQLGIKVPKRVFCAARKQQGQWQALLITEELSGFVSLDDWYAEHAPTLHASSRQAILQRLAQVLRRLHQSRRQHGCLYSKHIYISLNTEEPEVALLDLEKSRRRLRRGEAAQHDLSQLERRRGAMPESDWQYLLKCYNTSNVELIGANNAS